MEHLAVLPDLAFHGDGPIGLLIADDDPALRSLLAAHARETVEALVVSEAADGAEAIQVALQQRPRIALLDCKMPLLDGIGVALVLRELLPGLRLALHTADPAAYSDSARELCLPLFDKLDPEHALCWLERQARSGTPTAPFVSRR